MGQRSLNFYSRPKELELALRIEIADMFPAECAVDFEKEELRIFDYETNEIHCIIPMEILGKMIGLMNNAGVTTRKSKKESCL